MGVPEVVFSEPGRQKLALALFITHLVSVLFSLMLIGMGTYIKLSIEDKLSLTDDYNNDILPWMMVSMGAINMIVCGLGAFLCVVTRDVDKRKQLRQLQLPYVCVSLFSSICVFAAAMLAFAHIGHLHNSFANGLLGAMEQYKIDPLYKEDIDVLQMEYECCGTHDYRDWFKISWISNKYLNTESKAIKASLVSGEYFNDDVPFSCCDPSAVRPCVHHNVESNDAHFEYNHQEKTTLYQQGCRDALMDYFSKVLSESALLVIAIFGLQILIIVGMRFLHTSVGDAIDRGNAEGDAPGWLFGMWNEVSKDNDPQTQIPLLVGAGGDFSSDSSNAVFETEPPRRVGSSRRVSRSAIDHRSNSRQDPIYENIDAVQQGRAGYSGFE